MFMYTVDIVIIIKTLKEISKLSSSGFKLKPNKRLYFVTNTISHVAIGD
jgi:hypothetical protein